RNHPFTGLDYDDYYKKICSNEDCLCYIVEGLEGRYPYGDNFYQTLKKHPRLKVDGIIDCMLHNNGVSELSFSSAPIALYPLYTLYDFCTEKCEWGLLGSNKVNDEKLKLFPSKGGAQAVCDMVKYEIKKRLGKDVVVCVYGDGAFKSPAYQGVSVWEFADPCACPSYTNKELMESSPNEIKLKALIDNKTDEEIHKALSENVVQKASSMGTTPRLRRDLLASLFDLVSGSGDRATPVVLVKNYF
ncbi:MAG: coenzyme F420-0:L-glutamate ligase, partial [Bacteroidales bacterium]|nr:coenzyme F420-0:L-glutamate ligase [Bacteroidales bacterium]